MFPGINNGVVKEPSHKSRKITLHTAYGILGARLVNRSCVVGSTSTHVNTCTPPRKKNEKQGSSNRPAVADVSTDVLRTRRNKKRLTAANYVTALYGVCERSATVQCARNVRRRRADMVEWLMAWCIVVLVLETQQTDKQRSQHLSRCLQREATVRETCSSWR